MQVKFLLMGLGASLPSFKVGLNLASGCYLQFRDTPSSPAFVLGLATGFEFGASNGTLIGSYMESDWVSLDLKKHPWMCNQRVLIGKACKISLTGTVVRGGHVDITMTMFDKNHEEAYSFSKVYIKAGGIQLADAELKGILKSHEANMSLADRLQCAK